MQKTIYELVDQIESVLSKYTEAIPEHRVIISQDEIKELCVQFSFSDPKGLNELYPCVHYLLHYVRILPLKEIYEYRSIFEENNLDARLISYGSIESVKCICFAVLKDQYYALSPNGMIYKGEMIDSLFYPIAENLRSLIQAYTDMIIHLDENGLYNNHTGIYGFEPFFRQKLREYSPKLYKDTLAELEAMKNDLNLSNERLNRFSWLLLSVESAKDLFIIAENPSLDSIVREVALSIGNELLSIEEQFI
jgi:hypothetical protein